MERGDLFLKDMLMRTALHYVDSQVQDADGMKASSSIIKVVPCN